MPEEKEDSTLLADPAEKPPEPWFLEEQTDLVKQQGWKQPSDAVRDYGELQKSASSKIKLPSAESSAEEISAFYDKIRGVENPDGYEIKDIPENVPRDEDMEALVRKVAYENGGQKHVVENMIKTYYDALSQSITQARVESENTLKAEWKENYDTNLEVAKRACRELGGEEFVGILENTGLGNNHIFIKAFHNIGLKILNDTLIKGEKVGSEKQDEYKPAYPDSPEMYATDTSPDGERARLWFTKRGYRYK